jgi:hypothetical protein
MRIAQPNVERAASDVGRGACEAAQASDVDGESYRRGRHRRRRRRRRRRRATAQAGAAAAIVRRGPDAGWTTEGIGAEAQGAGRAAQRRASSSPRASAESAGAHPRTTPRASMGRPLSPSRPHVSERCPECPRLRPREPPEARGIRRRPARPVLVGAMVHGLVPCARSSSRAEPSRGPGNLGPSQGLEHVGRRSDPPRRGPARTSLIGRYSWAGVLVRFASALRPAPCTLRPAPCALRQGIR